jgi:hypothetical protein
MKVSTDTLREPTRPEKPDQQPEASLGWRSETTPSSVGSELQSRVTEPRKCNNGGAFVVRKTGATLKRLHGLAWKSARGLVRAGHSSTGCLGKLGEPTVSSEINRKGPHR